MNIQKMLPWFSANPESALGDLIDMTGVTALLSDGDSIMEGYTASSREFLCFMGRFNLISNIHNLTNTGLTSRKVLQVQRSLKGQSINRSTTAMFINIGLNDICTENDNAINRLQFQLGIRSIIGIYLAQTKVPSGHSSVTRSGTFTSATDFTGVGAVYPTGSVPGNVLALTTVANSYYEYTFTGEAIGFAHIARLESDTAYAAVEVRIDGVLVETFTPRYLSNEYDVYGNIQTNILHKNYWGLSPGSHTIRVTCTENKFLAIDYFYVPLTPSNIKPIVFQEIPYFSNSYYGTGHPDANYQKSSIVKSDLWSSYIKDIVDEYRGRGYLKIGYAKVNQYYDRVTGLDVDNIHPNTYGHLQITAGLFALTGLSEQAVAIDSDSFTGTTLDTGRWTKTNPTANAQQTQNNELILTSVGGVGSSTFYADRIESASTITKGSLTIDLVSTTNNAANGLLGVHLAIDTNNRVSLSVDTSGNIGFNVVSGGSITHTYVGTPVSAFGKKWKLVHTENDKTMVCYWSGNAWEALTVTPFNVLGAKKAVITFRNISGQAGTIKLDNYRLTNKDYIYEYPV